MDVPKSNSLDLENDCVNSLDKHYDRMEPVSRRDKRNKDRHRASKEHSLDRKKHQPRTSVNIIKEQYGENPSLCKLSGTDSDDNMDMDMIRERRDKKRKNGKLKKSITATRATERYQKKTEDVSLEKLIIPANPRKIDSANRFLCISSKPVYNTTEEHPDKTTLKRGQSDQVVFSSELDRHGFYKNFSALIRMGSQNKERRDKQLSHYGRQMSSEQERWQNKLNDILWLELQAWYWSCSLYEQDQLLLKEREKIPAVLNEIMSFKLEFSDTAELAKVSLQTHAGVDSRRTSTDFGDPFPSEVTLTFQSFMLTQQTLNCQKTALKSVMELLRKLDECEKLFPTTKALGKAYEMYTSEEFVHRVNSLYLWLNITQELCHKIRLLGRVLGLQQMEGLNWPWIKEESDDENQMTDDVNCDRKWSIPKIREPTSASILEDEIAEDNLEEESNQQQNHEGGNEKNVKFHLSESERSSRATSPSPSEVVGPGGDASPLKIFVHSNSHLIFSRDSSEVSLEDYPKTSIYHHFVDGSLKKMGMHKLLLRLRDILNCTLQRAKEALEKPNLPMTHAAALTKSPCEEKTTQVYQTVYPLPQDLKKYITYSRSSSLTEKGPWSKQFIEMGLPSFQSSYLFLLRVLLDVVHECLRLRLEQRPRGEPSFLSIRQLIRECKEVLRGAVLVKHYYQHMVSAAVCDDEMEDTFAMDLEQFDKDMKEMLEVYFSYLQMWMSMLQNLKEASHSLKNTLDDEWTFTKQICPYVVGGEAEAGKRFSTLASDFLSSIADFLETGIDDYTTNLFDLAIRDDGNSDNTSGNDNANDEFYDQSDVDDSENYERQNVRHAIQQSYRDFKNLFREARERTSKALGFAKMLKKDLEIAASFKIAGTTEELLKKLKATGHTRVIAPLSSGYLMFISEKIMDHRDMILQLLNVTCGKEDNSNTNPDSTATENCKDIGYLLMVRCGGGIDHVQECPVWTGSIVQVEPTAETAIALSHIEVDGLMLVVTLSSQLSTMRIEFENVMGDTVQVLSEQTSCHQAISESLVELKSVAMDLLCKITNAITHLDEKLYIEDMTKLEENERSHLLSLYCVTLLNGYNFGFEYHKELMRLVSGDYKHRLGRSMVNFSKNWMKFVSEKCERGRGTRPTWATQGLDFLSLVCDPKITSMLTDDEFKDLVKRMNSCISHVVGSVDKFNPRSPTHSLPSSKGGSPEIGKHQPSVLRFSSCPETTRLSRLVSTSSVQSDSTYSQLSLSPTDQKFSSAGSPMIRSRKDKVIKAVEELENVRTMMLQQKRIVGRKTSKAGECDYRIRVRKVNFRWQRGIKIGGGQFGKVYTALNVDTGEMMAIKEMKLQQNDVQKNPLKELVEEMKNLEGINHPNLVKYYGAEVHKDEMLIFMEYCDRGTIEEISKQGLPENMIRLYTRDILSALNHLHEHSIVHRDLKGANIFLTSDGLVKLGDFGCSVKLKSHTTMPGEITGVAGTYAYMAPEVLTKSDKEGHGRAADIWSLGCVVIEMASGKKPWHELDNYFQIMFKVGMGHTPSVPETLSAEGKDFLSHCLEYESTNRWTASELQNHPFPKVYEESDANPKGQF